MMNVQPKLDMVSILPKNKNDTRIPIDVRNALARAIEYIEFYDWMTQIKQTYLGAGFEGIVYLFLFEIISTRKDVDPWVWVVVGDIPPAYMTCEDARTPFEALDGYIGAMEEWVMAAQSGASVANVIPVNVPASPENAALLEKRLRFLDERILPSLKR